MPEGSAVRAFRRSIRWAAPGAASLALAGCLYAGAGIETASIQAAPRLLPDPDRPTATEIAYARDTAIVAFRRRDAERSEGFVAAEPETGFALCLRAGSDLALLVFQRRIFEDAVSQVADDAAILRSRRDTAICRGRTDWIAL